jgi:hypothetical protein
VHKNSFRQKFIGVHGIFFIFVAHTKLMIHKFYNLKEPIKMKINLKLLALSVALMFMFAFSCKKDSDTTVTNHTINIISQNSNNPVQFTYLIITPTDGSSAPIRNDFVLNPGNTLTIKVKLPGTGSYKIEVGGPSQTILWASIMMDSNNGTTEIDLIKSTYYCTNSRCSSILPTSCDPY